MPSFILAILLALLAPYGDLIDYAGPEAAISLVMACRGAQEYGYQVDPRRLATLAKYESGFRPDARGRAGERGLLQVHPCHRTSMKRMGLDFDNPADVLVYGALLYAWNGDKPWSVRAKARKDYERWFND